MWFLWEGKESRASGVPIGWFEPPPRALEHREDESTERAAPGATGDRDVVGVQGLDWLVFI